MDLRVCDVDIGAESTSGEENVYVQVFESSHSLILVKYLSRKV